MKAKIFSFLLMSMFLCSACVDKTGHATLFSMQVFIDGDTGKQVTITYLTAPEQKGPDFPNVEITRNVTIPFLEKIVTACWDGNVCDDQYIKVHTDGETLVKVVAFTNITLRDGLCDGYNVITRDDSEMNIFTDEECNYCRCCRYTLSLPMDSLYAYLEEINYPAYKIMHKGNADLDLIFNKVMYNWKNPYAKPNSLRYYEVPDSACRGK